MGKRTASSDDWVKPGQKVYRRDGKLLGRVEKIMGESCVIERVDEAEGSNEEELPGPNFGEGYIMWRCEECGEMGELDDGFPETCPNCGAPDELISAAIED